jgi:sugar phosphate isomerase/epimerase
MGRRRDGPVTRPTPAAGLRVLSVGTMRGVDIERYLSAASAAGFDAVSLRPRDVGEWVAAAAGRSVGGLRRLLDHHGLAVAEVDPVVGWESGQARGPVEDREQLAVLDAAAGLGARAVTALVSPGAPWDEPAAVDGLGTLCERAAALGLEVQVEFFAWSPLRELAVARRIVDATGAPNAGLLIDTWHLARGGGAPADVQATAVGQVLALQVADGPAQPIGDDVAAECRDHRLWPGEGAQHPEIVLASLRSRGWQGPVGVEVFGDATADPLGRARRAFLALAGLVQASAADGSDGRHDDDEDDDSHHQQRGGEPGM